MVWRLPEPWKWIVLAWFVGTFIISALLIIRDLRKEQNDRNQRRCSHE